MKFSILLSLFLLFCFVPLSGQFIPDLTSPTVQQDIRDELQRRGIDQAEVERRLQTRGVDLSNITPADIPTIEAVIAEMEREQANTPTSSGQPANSTIPTSPTPTRPTPPAPIQLTPDDATGVERAVGEGATVQEAINEAISEAAAEIDTTTARIYGQELFRNRNISVFRQSDNIRPGQDYILGSGDVVSIQIFGSALGTFEYTISDDGYIQPDRMQRINLKGLTLGQAQDLVRRRFRNFYTFDSGQFSMTVASSRTIRVNIYGNVQQSGAYTISAINTAFNALAAAGGPSNIGTVRRIQINRTGEPTQVLDLYDLLMRGKSIDRISLMNNDYIFVPIARRVVKIRGAVRRQASYELIEGEQLQTLIEYAGGLAENAYAPNIIVRRYGGDREEVFNVDYNELLRNGSDFELRPGDRVEVREQLGQVRNQVRIRGAVDFPTTYAVNTDGTRLSDLIRRASPRPDARLDQAFLLRLNPDSTYTFVSVNLEAALASPDSDADPLLFGGDQLRVISTVRSLNSATVSVRGAVEEGLEEYPFDASGNFRIRDALELAGGVLPTATDYGYVYRTDPYNPTVKSYLEFDVSEVLNNPASPQNIALAPNDVVRVLSILGYEDTYTVRITGEVRNPDTLTYAENLSLQDALRLTNGLRLGADPGRIEVFRKVLVAGEAVQVVAATVEVDPDLGLTDGADFLLEPFDHVIVRRIPEFDLEESIMLRGEVLYPGPYPILDDNERILDVIQRAGGLSPKAFPEGATLFRQENSLGYVVMRLNEVIENPNSAFNLVLKQGDQIYIPTSQDFVTIQGATDAVELYPNVVTADGRIAVAFQGNMRAAEYIDEFAAGPSKNADKSRIAVLHPNGEIKKTKSFLFFHLTPKVRKGSIISVPSKPAEREELAQNEERERVNWNKVIADSVGQATAILSLILLVQRVNN